MLYHLIEIALFINKKLLEKNWDCGIMVIKKTGQRMHWKKCF